MKWRAILLAVFAGVLAWVLFGCGEQSSSADSGAFVGTWDLAEMVEADETVGTDDIALLKSLDLETYLVIREDGTAQLNTFGDVAEGTWKVSEDNAGTLVFDKQAVDMKIDEGRLVLVQEGALLLFDKGDPREASSGSASDASAASASAASASASSASKESGAADSSKAASSEGASGEGSNSSSAG